MIFRSPGLFHSLFLATFLCLIFFNAACISDNYPNRSTDALNSGNVESWPAQNPRIKFIRSIMSPDDIGIKKSWLKKTVDSIFGKEEFREMMLRPYGIFADAEKIYVTDPGLACLHIFDVKRKKYLRINEVNGEYLLSPIGITGNSNGELFLSDSILKNIFVLDRSGKYLRQIAFTEGFIRPTGIAIDEDRIFVVDTHKHQVLVFLQSSGAYLFSFGRPGSDKGEFNYPTNIWIGRDNRIYIMDSMNFRVQVFTKNGEFLSTFGKLGDGSGNFSKPKGIAVDSDGNIYITDAHFDNVQIFDKDGKFLLWVGNSGRKNGEFFLPAGIFIDRDDRLYVADSYNNRLQIFQYLKREE